MPQHVSAQDAYRKMEECKSELRAADHRLVQCVRFGDGQAKDKLVFACRMAEAAYRDAKEEYEAINSVRTWQ